MSEESLETQQTKAETAAVAKVTVSQSQDTGSLIYVGPSIPGAMLNRFTVYQGGKPKHADETFKACPDIDRLFVPVEKLSETLEKIGKTGTPYNIWFNNVNEFLKKGVK